MVSAFTRCSRAVVILHDKFALFIFLWSGCAQFMTPSQKKLSYQNKKKSLFVHEKFVVENFSLTLVHALHEKLGLKFGKFARTVRQNVAWMWKPLGAHSYSMLEECVNSPETVCEVVANNARTSCPQKDTLPRQSSRQCVTKIVHVPRPVYEEQTRA